MEIEEDIYNKYRDTPYKVPDKLNPQESGKEENNHNHRKNDAYQELLDKIRKSVNEKPNSRYSDNITLNTTADKMIKGKEQGRNSEINKNNNVSEYNITISGNYEDTSTILKQQPDKRKSVVYINNAYQSEMEKQNSNNNDINNSNPFTSNNSNDKNNKIVSNFNNYSSLDNYMNADKVEVENTDANNYYNPFNQNNIHSSNNNNINSNNKTFKMPYITLTALKNDANEHKKGIFEGIINIFKKDKKNKPNNDNFDRPQENFDLEIENIDQKLRADPYLNNNNDNLNHVQDQNDYTLGSNNAQNNADTFGINNNANKNEEEIEPQNNYGYNINGTANNNNNQPNYFVVQAEPIEDNRNIFDPSNIHDMNNIDQNSMQAENDNFFTKIKKFSPFLIAILLASAGLLFLLYKNSKFREILINLLKKICSFVPNFFKGLISMYDFMITYEDEYRFLGGLIGCVFLFLILRIFISFIVKKMKGKNKEKSLLNNNNN